MVKLEQIKIKVKEAIQQSGITQTELAKKLEVYQSAISQFVSGQAMPALDTFANLCIILDLDANDILCISENRN